MAEELALEQGLGEGGAVDGHEGTLAARAVAMDGARRELLAGAALAQDQDRAQPRRDAGDGGVDLDHRRRAADHAGGGVAPRRRRRRVRRLRQRAAHRGADLLHVHRLADVLDRAEVQRLDRAVHEPKPVMIITGRPGVSLAAPA